MVGIDGGGFDLQSNANREINLLTGMMSHFV